MHYHLFLDETGDIKSKIYCDGNGKVDSFGLKVFP